jgi:hypothetical protein
MDSRKEQADERLEGGCQDVDQKKQTEAKAETAGSSRR